MATKELSVGDAAPDFTLDNQEGTPVSLKDFRGKKVLIYFYPKDNTPGCTKEACSLRDNFDALSKKGMVILGISMDGKESHQKFITKYNLPFYLLSDPNKETLMKYEAWGQKNMYGKLFNGVLRKSYIVDEEGNIQKIIKKVKTATHGEDVLNYI